MTDQELKEQFNQLKRVEVDADLIQKIKNREYPVPIVEMNLQVWFKAIAAVLVVNAICLGMYFGSNPMKDSTQPSAPDYYITNVNLYGDVE